MTRLTLLERDPEEQPARRDDTPNEDDRFLAGQHCPTCAAPVYKDLPATLPFSLTSTAPPGHRWYACLGEHAWVAQDQTPGGWSRQSAMSGPAPSAGGLASSWSQAWVGPATPVLSPWDRVVWLHGDQTINPGFMKRPGATVIATNVPGQNEAFTNLVTGTVVTGLPPDCTIRQNGTDRSQFCVLSKNGLALLSFSDPAMLP